MRKPRGRGRRLRGRRTPRRTSEQVRVEPSWTPVFLINEVFSLNNSFFNQPAFFNLHFTLFPCQTKRLARTIINQ